MTTNLQSSIIVVGPDGVGKTTLVRSISKRLGIPSFKCPSEKQIFRQGGRSSLAFDYTLTHFLRQTGHRFISDRGYPCEWVYSTVFGRETDMELLGEIDTQHALLGTRILYLYSSVTPFEEDDIVPSEKYYDIRDTYDTFVGWTHCRLIKMDTANMLTEYHQNSRDVSGLFAAEAIRLMELGEMT
jgi:GTPase SAR1 family protein